MFHTFSCVFLVVFFCFLCCFFILLFWCIRKLVLLYFCQCEHTIKLFLVGFSGETADKFAPTDQYEWILLQIIPWLNRQFHHHHSDHILKIFNLNQMT